MEEDEEALLSPLGDEFELLRASSYSGGVDILTSNCSNNSSNRSRDTEDSSSGVSCDSSPNIRQYTQPSLIHSGSTSGSQASMFRHPRMRGLKLRKSKSDKDIVSEIRKLRHWTRKEESDERTSPEGDDVHACLLEENGDNSSITSAKDLASTPTSATNNVSIDSACDPDFEVLAACKYKRAQMVRMVSTADSGIDIQITGPSPVHKPSKKGRQFRRAYSCKGRTSSLYLGESSTLPCKYLPQTVSDNHLDTQHEPTGYQIYRVRSFTTTNNSIVNKGDSFKIRPQSGSSGSVNSSSSSSRQQQQQQQQHPHHHNYSRHQQTQQQQQQSFSRRSTIKAAIRRSYFSSDCIVSQAQENVDWSFGRTVSMERLQDESNIYWDSEEAEEEGVEEIEEPDIPVFKVAVLGSQGVGKTTVTRQLLTSEYLQNATCDVTQDDDPDVPSDRSVTVLLDDEETLVQFIDVAGEEANQRRDAMDAYIVVYSVTDSNSFRYAHACLQDIRGDRFSNAVVILVANKQDLVRNKVVMEEEGKALAVKCDCKYIEVSAILDHKVPELLVGIVRQIRLQRLKQSRDLNESSGDLLSYTGCLQRTAFELFRRIFRRSISTSSKSCDNLLI